MPRRSSTREASPGSPEHRPAKKEGPGDRGLPADIHAAHAADGHQKVMLQRFSVPVSAAALSDTRKRHVPFFGSLDRFTV